MPSPDLTVRKTQMTIRIVPLDEGLVPQVAQAFSTATSHVPHCYPVSAEEYVAATKLASANYGRNTLRSQRTMVALSSGRVLGFATTALGTHGKKGSEESALIRMLWYERGYRRAGQALLNAAEQHLTGLGHNEISAFDQDFRFPGYYLPPADLTDRWDHVHGLLGINGYERKRGEVFLDWRDFRPPDPGACPVAADIRVERLSGDGARDEISVGAYVSEKIVGTCICMCGGEFARDSQAQDWLFTVWLHVDEGLRAKGLGRYLLLRALNEARTDGYVHATISTDRSNHRALLLYGNIGYQSVDWTSMYRKGTNNESA